MKNICMCICKEESDHMEIMNKLYKWFSYFFILLIIGLVILTFGMPDYMGSSSSADRYIAARIGSEVITKKEISNIKDNIIKNQFKNENVSGQLLNYINQQAMDQAIRQKLFIIISKDGGLYPLSKAFNKLTARFLEVNFLKYQNENGYDFKTFEKEILTPNQLAFSDIKNMALWEYGLQKNDELLRKLAYSGKREINDDYLLKNSTISYEIFYLSDEAKKKSLKNLIGITEQDIQEKFKTEYLAKNKDEKLTDIKREAIENSILNERKGKFETDWFNNLTKDTESMSSSMLAKKYQGKTIRLLNVDLNSNLSAALNRQHPGERGIILSQLDDYNPLIENIFTAKLNQNMKPWNIGTDIFVVTILDRKIADENKSAETNNEEIKNMHLGTMYSSMFEITKLKYPVMKIGEQEPKKNN